MLARSSTRLRRIGMVFNTKRKELENSLREEGRLPPGQYVTLKWPVLHEGPIPNFDAAKWDFRIRGLVENPFRLTWNEFKALPRKRIKADFHCVTSWSKFDNEWEGVPFRVLAETAGPRPEARFVMVHAENGYTTNVPVEDLMHEEVLFADWHAPEPLTAEHGAPLRLIVPHLYAWKSAKWVRGLDFLDRDRAGFWEQAITCTETRSKNKDIEGSERTTAANPHVALRFHGAANWLRYTTKAVWKGVCHILRGNACLDSDESLGGAPGGGFHLRGSSIVGRFSV